jgi:hypothetical protein
MCPSILKIMCTASAHRARPERGRCHADERRELPALQAIERFIGQKNSRLKLEAFRYLHRPV